MALFTIYSFPLCLVAEYQFIILTCPQGHMVLPRHLSITFFLTLFLLSPTWSPYQSHCQHSIHTGADWTLLHQRTCLSHWLLCWCSIHSVIEWNYLLKRTFKSYSSHCQHSIYSRADWMLQRTCKSYSLCCHHFIHPRADWSLCSTEHRVLISHAANVQLIQRLIETIWSIEHTRHVSHAANILSNQVLIEISCRSEHLRYIVYLGDVLAIQGLMKSRAPENMLNKLVTLLSSDPDVVIEAPIIFK